MNGSPSGLIASANGIGDLLQVLFEDDDLLVLNKPAGLVCHPTKTDEYSSLIGRVRLYLKGQKGSRPSRDDNKLAEPLRPHLVNRLDRETSGVVVVAKGPEAAGALGKLWESRSVEKEYVALVHGHVPEHHAMIDAPLGKDEQSQIAIKDCVRPDGAEARTEYWVESRISRDDELGHLFTRLRLVPHTGRKHQLRIHLAHIGHPIVGDKLYGGDEDLYLALVQDRLTSEQRKKLVLPNHALHARSVCFPWRGAPRFFQAEPPSWAH